ncbi:MAG: HAD hydrolase family protein [Armatimonadota bacterium]|nr:HAD hydrolase family protein [Armatimonadota bacterium]
MSSKADIEEKLAKVKLLAMDVDGTLTDGAMTIHDGHQIKSFHAHDGLGIRLAMNYGLRIAWVTGNLSSAVADRARALGVTELFQNCWVKSKAIDELANKYGLDCEEIAFMGDDLNDLAAFERAGVAIAVANATEEVKKRAHCVTSRPGGQGAVREAIEMILKARGEWEAAVSSFLAALELQEAEGGGPEAIA